MVHAALSPTAHLFSRFDHPLQADGSDTSQEVGLMAFIGQAAFSFAGFFSGQLMRFLLNLVIARMLGPDALGMYALALAFLQVTEIVAVMGLDAAMLRYVGKARGSAERPAVLIASGLKGGMLFSLGLAVLLYSASEPLGRMFGGDELLGVVIAAYALALPFTVMISLGGHAMQAVGHVEEKVLTGQVLFPLCLVVVTVLFGLSGNPAGALLFPMPLAAVTISVWTAVRVVRITGVGPRAVIAASFHRGMYRYAVPLMFVGFLGMLGHWLDIILLGAFCTAADVGSYQPAVRSAGLLRSFLLAFSGVAAPMFATLYSQNKGAEVAALYGGTTRLLVAAVLPAWALLSVMPKEVMTLFGAPFVASAPLLVMLAAGVLVQAVSGLGDTMLQMSGHARFVALNSAGALLCQMVLGLLLIPQYGVAGAAAGVVGAYVLAAVLRSIELKRVIGTAGLTQQLWKPVAALLPSVLLVIALHPFVAGFGAVGGLGVGAVVLCSCYALILALTGFFRDATAGGLAQQFFMSKNA
ncbi:oligosaccharide flippase family protein [Prosthecochloris sp. CIB 2401]|uniref:oligosaccharide flippase family protein n=1 Tax=Prosthecochloris sp. CIB 2401 TaxID=1868325 RepID=UPI00138FA76A|nr:oligosaccharide flippase family protein [Prosthecochloris sp. CIB 2401]